MAFVSRYSVREHPDFLPITYMGGCGNGSSWNGNARTQNGKISRKWTRMDANHDSVMVTLFSWSPCLVALTTSWPLVTCPKTVCLPSSQLVTTWVMKNWLPLVPGPALAMESVPTLCLLGLPLHSSSKR